MSASHADGTKDMGTVYTAAVGLDLLAPNYRRAHLRWPSAALLSEHYRAIVVAYEAGHCSLPEQAKAYVECVCRTVLDDCGRNLPETHPPLGRLLSAAFEAVGLENTRDGSNANRILGCYNRLGEALNDARNTSGSVAHGRDGFLDALSMNQSRSLLLAGDTLIAVLLEALEGRHPNLRFTREPYERFGHLHDRIDSFVVAEPRLDEEDGAIVVTFQWAGADEGFDIRVTPSELLFGLDRLAYLSVLESAAAYGVSSQEDLEPDEMDASADSGDTSPPLSSPGEPIPVMVESYAGRLNGLRTDLEPVVAELWSMAPAGKRVDEGLIDSILATADQNSGLDWSMRESGRARVRVALRRLMQALGAAEGSQDWANRLEHWLVAHWDEVS